MSKLEDVEEFHSKMGFYPHVEADEELFEAVKNKRKAIIMEEAQELCDAIDSGNPASILHESVDFLYVGLGCLHEFGITKNQLDVAWEMVHEANMAKTPPANPLEKAEKGKRWKKAEVSKALSVKHKVLSVLVSYVYKKDKSWEFGNSEITLEGDVTKNRLEQITGLLMNKHGTDNVVISNVLELS